MSLIVTARVNELPPDSVPISDDDLFILYQVADNVTVKRRIGDLRTYIASGGPSTSAPPVVSGNSVFVTITAAQAGTQICSIPSLQGKQFVLRRQGLGPLDTDEYEILTAGGFKLMTPGDLLVKDEVFELEIYNSIPGGGVPLPGAATGAFVTGIIDITTNYTINPVDDIGKIFRIRGDNTSVTINLPDVDDVPDNSILIFETAITNNVQHKLQPQGAQFIYMNNQSFGSLYISTGEVLWLFRYHDGYYVINDFGAVYKDLGMPHACYRIESRDNKMLCDGTLKLRASYPRLWEKIQTFGSSLVTDTVWNTVEADLNGRMIPKPYRGCFSTGDGSTTFRVPDLRDMFLRGTVSYSGTQDRIANYPGGFQDDGVKYPGTNIYMIGRRTSAGGPIEGYRAGNNAPGSDNYDEVAWPYANVDDTRPKNIGVLWAINF